jgi:predicted nucleic acid-binding protein
MTAPIALDTSVAIPLLVQSHQAHPAVVSWWDHREVALCGHAVAETYAVLTRLPGDLRLTPSDAAVLLNERFAPPLLLGSDVSGRLPDVLSRMGVAGGAVYDAMVALAAAEHGADLATRDARARATYESVGVRVVIAD